MYQRGNRSNFHSSKKLPCWCSVQAAFYNTISKVHFLAPTNAESNPARQIQTGKRIHTRHEDWDYCCTPSRILLHKRKSWREEVPLSGLFSGSFSLSHVTFSAIRALFHDLHAGRIGHGKGKRRPNFQLPKGGKWASKEEQAILGEIWLTNHRMKKAPTRFCGNKPSFTPAG